MMVVGRSGGLGDYDGGARTCVGAEDGNGIDDDDHDANPSGDGRGGGGGTACWWWDKVRVRDVV